MDILYLAHRIPYPPDKGDKLRSFRQLEFLAKRHRVWCACFVDTPDDVRHVHTLRGFCHNLVAVSLNRRRALVRGAVGLIWGGTMTESFYADPVVRGAVRRWCETVRFDAVVAFSSSMAPYALQVPARRRILDLCDLDSRKWMDYATAGRGPMRWLYHVEGTRLARRERAWIAAFDATLLITQAEAALLDDRIPPGKVHIIGNGVTLPDEDDCVPLDGPSAESVGAVAADGAAQQRIVGFIGAMDYRPNVDAVCWFTATCWREIRAICPRAVFRIVGRSPTRRVRRLAAVPGVEVTGYVDDALAEVGRFGVSVAPMRIARGLQNKVLEAMASQKPVVLTTPAATGIAGRHGKEFLIADRPDDIIRSVTRLLNNPTECKRIGNAARRFVAANHSWEDSLRAFELMVTGASGRTAHGPSLQPAPVAVPADDLNFARMTHFE